MDLACVETQIGDGDTADCEVLEFREGSGVGVEIRLADG